VSPARYSRHRLANGLRLVTCTLQESRAVSIRAYLDGGSRAEPDDRAGAAHFLEHAVFKGTRRWPSARQIGLATERFGGSADAFTDKDHSGFVIHGPAVHFALFAEVLADLLIAPLLDPGEIERERAVIAEELRACRDDADDLAKTQLERLLWPRHPLGREILGTQATIRSLTADDLDRYRQLVFSAANTVISVASPLPTEEIVRGIEIAFGAWSGDPIGPSRPPPAPPIGPATIVESRRGEQARFRIGFIVPSRAEPGRHTLDVLTTCLAGPATSRLELKLREELGLVYDVTASLEQYVDTGLLTIVAGVHPDRLTDAVRAIVEELRAMRGSIGIEEAASTRDYLIGRWLCAEGTDFHASFAGRDEQVFGCPTTVDAEIDALRAVTVEEMIELAHRTMVPANCYLSVVGPSSSVRTARRILDDL